MVITLMEAVHVEYCPSKANNEWPLSHTMTRVRKHNTTSRSHSRLCRLAFPREGGQIVTTTARETIVKLVKWTRKAKEVNLILTSYHW